MAPSEGDSNNNPPLPEDDPSWTVVENRRKRQPQRQTMGRQAATAGHMGRQRGIPRSGSN
eukprot:5505327-Heterocapsa_arctica.AAC.1